MPTLQQHQSLLLPQAYLTNLPNRIRNEPTLSLLDTSLVKTQVRGHKRAKVVNYAEFDNELFDDLADFDGVGDVNMGGGDMDDNDNTNSAAQPDNYDNNNSSNNSNNHNTGTSGDADNDEGAADEENNSNKRVNLKDRLPDLDEQDDLLNVLKYPKIRETFQQSKLATPYRLNLLKNVKNTIPLINNKDTISSSSLLQQQQDETDTTEKDNSTITPTIASSEPIIIPIALNIENNGMRIIDHFTWNINDNSMTPEEFANIYCQDLDLNNYTNLNQQITNVIIETIQENENLASIKFNQDLQILVNLTCHLQDWFLEDNFQWNLNDPSLTPESFAEILVVDLGLKREFLPIITYALYDSLLKIKKEYMDGNLNTAANLNNEAAFGYLAGVRLNLEDIGENWAPKIELLTPEEIQRKEIEKERKLRRLKRENDRLGRRGRRRLDELELTMKL
ncbi:chromatin structure-remodeling complex subunit Sfh1p [Monosporozyma servazzii]